MCVMYDTTFVAEVKVDGRRHALMTDTSQLITSIMTFLPAVVMWPAVLGWTVRKVSGSPASVCQSTFCFSHLPLI